MSMLKYPEHPPQKDNHAANAAMLLFLLVFAAATFFMAYNTEHEEIHSGASMIVVTGYLVELPNDSPFDRHYRRHARSGKFYVHGIDGTSYKPFNNSYSDTLERDFSGPTPRCIYMKYSLSKTTYFGKKETFSRSLSLRRSP